MLDFVITGGTVVDGTGSHPEIKDIGITGDTITEIGDLSKVASRFTLSAAGGPARSGHVSRKLVCPGFIDAHSHSDAYLLIEPSSPSKIFQGITTEIVGNCGASAAPLVGDYHMPSDWRDKEYPGQWSTVAEYRSLLEAQNPAPNVVLLTGHNTLRVGVAGYENRLLTSAELETMKDLLRKSMDEGSHGLSSGLIYAPGMYAPREELVELAKTAAEMDGIYTSHMRSESGQLLEAIKEAISIGKEAGTRVEISHLKTSGKNNWGLIDEALDLIRSAREEGIEVCADRYPYLAGATELDVVLPAWAAEGGRDAIMERLHDKSTRKRIYEELTDERSADEWGHITIGSTTHPDNKRFQGTALVEAAESLGLDIVDAILHIIEADELQTGAFFAGMSQDNMETILKEPYVMLGSDASLRSTTGPLSKDYPHPRAYGSFPKFIRMVLDKEMMPLEEAIRKMTTLPAKQFRVSDRGAIEKGMKADIIVFDEKTLNDKSNYGDPHRLSEGIEHVFVNGVHTIDSGKLSENRGGRVL
jgi:N-acyl-D-amino-acid deacylase